MLFVVVLQHVYVYIVVLFVCLLVFVLFVVLQHVYVYIVVLFVVILILLSCLLLY